MDRSKAARGVLTSSTLLAIIAALSEFQTWGDFLVWLVSTAGIAAAVFGTIEIAEWPLKRKDPPRTLNSDLKYYGAMALALVYPGIAFSIGIYSGLMQWDAKAFFAVLVAALKVADTIHREFASQEHKEAHLSGEAGVGVGVSKRS